MQIVIPMSGYGERFRAAGYAVPKPLLMVEGKPIIQHVVEMFPGEHQFHFVCNKEHLANPEYGMRAAIQGACAGGRIHAIEPHRLGPVHAVLEIVNELDLSQPTVVNYCDFCCYWDFADFESFVGETECDGALACYRGFHPHMLGSTSYAYVREVGRWAYDIREKQSFTDDPTNEFASSGTYYFASGQLMRSAFEQTVAGGLNLKGEHYVSLSYKPLFDVGYDIAVYELQHFMQWGTPADFEEYLMWSSAFRRLVEQPTRLPGKVIDHVLIPMAGLGTRFSREGYETPKAMLPVSGTPMVARAAMDLPRGRAYRFVVRSETPSLPALKAILGSRFPNVSFVELPGPTDGQARTCLLGLQQVGDQDAIAIGACDNGALYDGAALAALLDDDTVDVIVWGVRSYPGAIRNPSMYGWIAETGGDIASVSVKKPLDDPRHDPIVVGTFIFKRMRDFVTAAERMIKRDKRVNGEFYVDTCVNDAIAMGLRCRLFEIDNYLCWGTPDDLRTFEYWQSCFHKWFSHPYRLDADRTVEQGALAALTERCAPWVVPRPRPHGRDRSDAGT